METTQTQKKGGWFKTVMVSAALLGAGFWAGKNPDKIVQATTFVVSKVKSLVGGIKAKFSKDEPNAATTATSTATTATV